MEKFSLEHLRRIGMAGVSASREDAAKEVEKVIRQFDPCISCSVH